MRQAARTTSGAWQPATDARRAGPTAVTVARRAGGTQLRALIRDGRDAADAPARPRKHLETAAASRRRVPLVAAAEEEAGSGHAARPGSSEKGLRCVLGGCRAAVFGAPNAFASALEAPGPRALPIRLATPRLPAGSRRLQTATSATGCLEGAVSFSEPRHGFPRRTLQHVVSYNNSRGPFSHHGRKQAMRR